MNTIPEDAPYRVRFGKNKSWFNSLGLTAGRVIFYAPSSLWFFIGDAVVSFGAAFVTLITSLLAVILGIIAWVGTMIIQILAGLAGYIKRPD